MVSVFATGLVHKGHSPTDSVWAAPFCENSPDLQLLVGVVASYDKRSHSAFYPDPSNNFLQHYT